MLCKLVLSEPDVLVMDEPTNHLDIASREMLESALDDYAGTIIAVSHDRYFLDRVVEKLLVIGTDELGNRQLGRSEFIDAASETSAYSTYASVVRQRIEEQRVAQETSRQAEDKSRKGRTHRFIPSAGRRKSSGDSTSIPSSSLKR